MTYELINTSTTNTLASFLTEAEAREALERFRAADEQFASTLTLVAFDDDGLALDEELPSGARGAEVVPPYAARRAATA